VWESRADIYLSPGDRLVTDDDLAARADDAERG
jgi:hypothetical protein